MNLPDDYTLWQGDSPLDLVADFALAFCPDHLTDQVIDEEILKTPIAHVRMGFIQEEMDELWEAYRNADPVEFTDAVVDLLYFLYGTALALGIPLEEAFLEVHDSNMAKLNEDGSVSRHVDTGKVLKPAGWKAPDLARVLEEARAA